MKWLVYVGWFVVWFFIRSFVFVPIIRASENALVDALAAAINAAILVGGFYLRFQAVSEEGIHLTRSASLVRRRAPNYLLQSDGFASGAALACSRP